MVITIAKIQEVLGDAYNPAARYSVYGQRRSSHSRGPTGRLVGEFRASNDTFRIYESLPEAPDASTTKEPQPCPPTTSSTTTTSPPAPEPTTPLATTPPKAQRPWSTLRKSRPSKPS